MSAPAFVDPATVTLHVSTVAIDGRAVMIEGPSGSGKSDLALRLIDRGAVLVSDDYTILTAHDAQLMARAPDTIAGRMEIRGLGIVPMPRMEVAPAVLLIKLADLIDRMPPEKRHRVILGIHIPEIELPAHEASTPIKVELALKRQIG